MKVVNLAFAADREYDRDPAALVESAVLVDPSLLTHSFSDN